MFKPIVHIFQNSPEMLKKLLQVISNYVSQKRESNVDSLIARIYQIIKNMVKDSIQLESTKIWENVKEDLMVKILNPKLFKLLNSVQYLKK